MHIHVKVLTNMFNVIVCSGGAVNALSFFGCVMYLEHVGLLSCIDTFVGSSAGTVVGFMIIVGFSPREACDFFMKAGVHDLSLTELDVFDAMFGERTCLDTLGFDDGSRWSTFLADALQDRLGCRDITFSDLAKVTGKVLVVCVTNLTQGQRQYLSVETMPDMSVVLAVRMSLSIPILYVPVIHDGCIYVDGSVLDNLPVAFSLSKGGPPNTLALHIIEEALPLKKPCPLSPSPYQYISMLLGVVMSHAQRNNENGPDHPEITRVGVSVPTTNSLSWGFDLRSLTFTINRERLDDLVERGYNAARHIIEPMIGYVTEAGIA